MIELLPQSQQQIIRRAANRIKSQDRAAFTKYVADTLRGRRDPPSDDDTRYACGEGICRFGRKI
jgi:hypothetical protein